MRIFLQASCHLTLHSICCSLPNFRPLRISKQRLMLLLKSKYFLKLFYYLDLTVNLNFQKNLERDQMATRRTMVCFHFCWVVAKESNLAICYCSNILLLFLNKLTFSLWKFVLLYESSQWHIYHLCVCCHLIQERRLSRLEAIVW